MKGKAQSKSVLIDSSVIGTDGLFAEAGRIT